MKLAYGLAVCTLFLSSAVSQVGSAEPTWSRPSTPRRIVPRRFGERVAEYPRKAVARDRAVVAAVWEEDDDFVASFVAKTQAVVDRSVVVRRSTARRRPPRDRLAQRPEDPFEQAPATDESALDFEIEDPPIEEVKDAEEALKQEFDRRESEQELSDQDLFGDPAAEADSSEDADSQDLFEEETLEEEAMEDEPEVSEDDPFDEPLVEELPEPGAAGAMEQELEKAPKSERDLFDESFNAQDDLESDNLSELFDKEMRQDESEGAKLFEADNEDLGLDVETDEKPIDALESEANETNDEISDDMLAEREESERNCAEEIAKFRADRIDNIELSILLDGSAGEDFPYECWLDAGQHQPRQWPQITYNWKAAALCHKPLYFEQVHLERYGHSWGPYVQPIMSGVHFFGTLPILPYKMGIRTPTECVYTLGYYRPGSCAPYLVDPIPFTWRAALFQAGFATGASFAIP